MGNAIVADTAYMTKTFMLAILRSFSHANDEALCKS